MPNLPRRGVGARRIMFCIAAAFLMSTHAMAASSLAGGGADRPLDPLFNLPYNPAEIQFDCMRISAAGGCAPLLESLGHGTGRVKVFGQAARGGSRIMMLGDEDPGAPRGLSGVVLVMRAGSCRTAGPLLALRRTKVDDPELDPALSATDVAMLLRDVFSRYTRAFGNKAAFLAWADRLTYEAECVRRAAPELPCPLLYTSLFTPEMREALEAFRKGSVLF